MDPERVRQDFPTLAEADGQPVAYLDNACTTLKPYSVVAAVADYYRHRPVCGGRSLHRMGRRVTQDVEASRHALSGHLGLSPADVAFTRNATQAINLVAHGLAWRRGDVVLTTDKEHNSNFVPWLRLADTRGVVHRAVPTHPDGTFDREAFAVAIEAAGDRLRLVSVAHVSNADGVEAPMPWLARRVHDAGATLLVDAAQSAAHRPVRLADLGADLLVLSLHKMLGPSGVGALAATPEAWQHLEPADLGGGTVTRSGPDGYTLADRPDRYEAGLGNFAGLVAVAPGLDYLQRLGWDALAAHARDLNRHGTQALAALDGVRVHGPPWEDRTSILPFTVDGLDPHDVAVYLDEAADVAVRSGAHCVHGHYARQGIPGTVRASFHAYNTRHDVDRLVAAVGELVAGLRTPRAVR